MVDLLFFKYLLCTCVHAFIYDISIHAINYHIIQSFTNFRIVSIAKFPKYLKIQSLFKVFVHKFAKIGNILKEFLKIQQPMVILVTRKKHSLLYNPLHQPTVPQVVEDMFCQSIAHSCLPLQFWHTYNFEVNINYALPCNFQLNLTTKKENLFLEIEVETDFYCLC